MGQLRSKHDLLVEPPVPHHACVDGPAMPADLLHGQRAVVDTGVVQEAVKAVFVPLPSSHGSQFEEAAELGIGLYGHDARCCFVRELPVHIHLQSVCIGSAVPRDGHVMPCHHGKVGGIVHAGHIGTVAHFESQAILSRAVLQQIEDRVGIFGAKSA